jgi:hypothetical protein
VNKKKPKKWKIFLWDSNLHPTNYAYLCNSSMLQRFRKESDSCLKNSNLSIKNGRYLKFAIKSDFRQIFQIECILNNILSPNPMSRKLLSQIIINNNYVRFIFKFPAKFHLWLDNIQEFP